MSSIGIQTGGVLNVCALEVGYITENPDLDTTTIVPVGLHPLLVAPTAVRYQDATRSPVQEATAGALKTAAGRALRPVQINGSFGIAARGIGPYLGTGEVRFQRFYAEVVRMSEARTRAEVDALINGLTGSLGLRTRLAGWNPQRSSWYVNWYDLINGLSFEVQIGSFNWSREHRNGGAQGLVTYQLGLKEVGPTVVALGSALRIDRLFAGLRVWGELNETIKSYSPAAVREGLVEMVEPVATALTETIDVVSALQPEVTNLMGGAPQNRRGRGGRAARDTTTGTAGGATVYLARSAELSRQASDAAAAIVAVSTGEPDAVVGVIPWSSLIEEGDLDELRRFEGRVELWDVVEAADWQPTAGVLFGMSRDEYLAYLLAQASGGSLGPVIGGTITHVVRDTDTAASIEQEFHVAWSTVLDVNGLTPDEALTTGVTLRIPTTRARGPKPITGLPTFGSHVGPAAWGSDIDLLGRILDGVPVLVQNEDCLSQGIGMLIEEVGAQLLAGAEVLPSEAQAPYVAARVRSALLLDPRVVGVNEVTVEASSIGLDVVASVSAINGGTIRTGGGA